MWLSLRVGKTTGVGSDGKETRGKQQTATPTWALGKMEDPAPVDPAQLKGDVKNWRLGHDMSLQRYLSVFSANVAEKTRSLVTKVDDLANDASEADVRLRSTFCEFLMLANSQFIENVS